jgi:hypothetical protein
MSSFSQEYLPLSLGLFAEQLVGMCTANQVVYFVVVFVVIIILAVVVVVVACRCCF